MKDTAPALVCPWCSNHDPKMITPTRRVNGSGRTIWYCEVCGKEFDA